MRAGDRDRGAAGVVGLSTDGLKQQRSAGNGLTMMIGIGQTDEQIPPVEYQGDAACHQAAAFEIVRCKPAPATSIPQRLACARLPSVQSKDCTDVSDRSFGRSILLNAGGILGIQAMTHYDWDALVSLMGSSILSEGCQHLDSQDGALQCYYFPLNRLPASRLLLPRSGLERSDFVHWPQAAVGKCLLFRRCQGISRHQANGLKMTRADIALEQFIERFKRCRGL
jgi:hypothetical protein